MKTILCWLRNFCGKLKASLVHVIVFIKVLTFKICRFVFVLGDKFIVACGTWYNCFCLLGKRVMRNDEGLLSVGSRRYRVLEFYSEPGDVDLGIYDIMFFYRAHGVTYCAARRKYEKL